MKAYLSNLPMTSWLLLAMTVVIVAYPVAQIVVPTVVHAVVPEVVRSLLKLI